MACAKAGAGGEDILNRCDAEIKTRPQRIIGGLARSLERLKNAGFRTIHSSPTPDFLTLSIQHLL